MKLLLTSSGISNKTIASALEKLLESSLQGIKLSFIPTAANVEEGDKSWMLDDLAELKNYGFAVDIVDISALPENVWLPRLESAKVLFLAEEIQRT